MCTKAGERAGSLPLLNFLRQRALLRTNVNIRVRSLSTKIRRNSSLLERIGAKCAAARRALSASFVFYNCGEKRDVSEINRVFLVFSICKLSRHCLPTHRNFFCSGLDKSDRSRCTGNTLAISQFSLMHTILYIFFNITFAIIAKFRAEICIYPE